MRLISTNYLSRILRLAVGALESIHEKYYAQPKAKLIHGEHILQEGESNSESTFSQKLVGAIERDFEKARFHMDKLYETEMPKRIIFRNDDKRKTYGPTFDKLFHPPDKDHEEFFTIPDIVIHAGQNDFQTQNQLFIAELKTTPNLTQGQFNIDLFKTAVYHDDLKFSYSAFLIINVAENDVREMYKKYCSNGYYLSGRPGMYIIVKNGYDSPVKVYRIN